MFLGYSLGGRLAFELARLLSTNDAVFNVNAIVLLSSAPPPRTETEIVECAKKGMLLERRINEVSPTKEAFSHWLHEWYGSHMWGNLREARGYEEMVERRLQRFDESRKKAYAEAAKTMAIYESGFQNCLKLPSLYLYGEKDVKYGGYGEMFMALLEGCEVVGVEDAGHNILVQGAETVQQTVETFLRKCCVDEEKNQSVRDVKVLRYLLPMKKEIAVNGIAVKARTGVLVALRSTESFLGVGDICPLPGVHEHSLQSCLAEVERFCVQLNENGNVFSRKRFSLRELEQLVRGLSNVSKSGITCALITLLMEAWNMDLTSVIKVLISNCTIGLFEAVMGRLNRLNVVYLNGVLPRLYPTSEANNNVSEDRRTAINSFLQNTCFETLKVKVGITSCPADEAQYIREAIDLAKLQGQRLRLDANRAWTKQQFDVFQRSLAQDSAYIEFIEEPLHSVSDLATYLKKAQTGNALNIGLDESLSGLTLELIRSLSSSSSCRAVVLKPAVIGSLTRILELFEIATQSNCEVIMSTVFDSGVGTAWTSLLASVFGDQQTCHGLGTFQYLLNDVIDDSFEQTCLLGDSSISSGQCRNFLINVAKHVMDIGVSVTKTESFCP